ncbi:hypothetical protein [Methylobacterium sp. SI9]|uniref:hypothetical protein n=1 Tax=Methylobacterium guangdongense TaxID=3138811 RepID=UPI00313AF324
MQHQLYHHTAGPNIYALALFTIIILAAGQISALPEQALGWLSHVIERRAVGQAASSALPASLGHSAASRGFRNIAKDAGQAGRRVSQWWTRRKQLRGGSSPSAGF